MIFNVPLHITVAATQTPSLYLLDLLPGANPSVRLRAAEKQERGLALTSAAFNRGGRGMVSAGDSFGRVHVWQLSEMVRKPLNQPQNCIDAVNYMLLNSQYTSSSASGASEMRLLDTFLGLENSGSRDKRGDGSDDETDGEDEE